MTGRVLLGTLASAVALMAWGFFYWVLLFAPGAPLRAIPDESQLTARLLEALPQSGVYAFPMPPAPVPGDGAAVEAFRQRHAAGPIGMILFTREGREPLSGRVYLQGFAQALGASLLAALLLAMTLPALEGFSQRLAFVFALGLFAGVSARLYDPIWWNLPWQHALHMFAFQGVGWFVAGLVLAAIVQPARGGYHDTDPSKPLWKRALDVD